MIGISTRALIDPLGMNVHESIFKLEDLGFSHIELGAAHRGDPEKVKDACTSLSASFSLHSPFPPQEEPFILNLASLDATVLEASRSDVSEAIAFAASIDASHVVVHNGFTGYPTLDLDFGEPARISGYEKCYELMVESLGVVVDAAEEFGVAVGVENLESKHFGYMKNDPREFESYLAEVDGLGVVLDIGHMFVASRRMGYEPEDLLNAVRKRIVGIHVSDNDGLSDTHSPPGDGVLPLGEVLPTLPKDCPWVIELENCTEADIVRAKKFLEKFN